MKTFLSGIYNKILRNELYRRIIKHDVVSYSAQSAYYLMLAIFPFIILIIMLLTILGVDYLDDIDRILSILPNNVIPIIKEYLLYSKELSSSVFSPLLITSILISSGAITSLARAFNIANDIKEGRSFLKQKLLSAIFLISLVIIFTITLSISFLGLEILNEVFYRMGIERTSVKSFKIWITLLNFVISLSIICLMYYVLPAKKISIKMVIPGALIATPSIALLSNLFSYFVNNFTRYSLVYGSLTSIVMLMIWLFFCAFILILGEEINVMVWERRKNKKQ